MKLVKKQQQQHTIDIICLIALAFVDAPDGLSTGIYPRYLQ